MRFVSKRQKEKDPNAVCSVSSFTPRPMLRVGGGKDKGTRFLSFVDAMLGFRHLLTQEDLDKAASMCQGLKGHLRSRFLVLSDDRQPPPPPTKKRPFNDDEEESHGKRFQNERPRSNAQVQPVNLVQVRQPGNQAVSTQPQQVHPVMVHQAGSSGHPGYYVQQTAAQALSGSAIFSPGAFPPLQVSQPVSQSHPVLQQPKLIIPGDGYQTVKSRSSRRQSQRVQGVEKIEVHRPRGLTEELEQIDEVGSDNSFVDANEI